MTLVGTSTTEGCRVAEEASDLAAHHAVRHAVFVVEQELFAGSDHDEHDDDPATVHVVGIVDGVPSGSVRLFPVGDGLWKGDRLAVLPGHRTGRLGGTLVRFAVATADRLGGDRMIATVQQPNERFFHRLGWVSLGGPELYLGVPHVEMEISFRTAT